MSVLNEISAAAVQTLSGTNTPRAERSENSEARATEVRPVHERQAKQANAKSPAEQVSPTAVSEAVNAINAQVQRVSQNLKFFVDHDSGRVVVKVMDGETDKVIRQIPSEEAVAISDALDKLQGIIIQQKA